MKTEYLLALSIVAFFVSAAFFFMAQMETASIKRLQANLNEASVESESARLTVLLAQGFGPDTNYCGAMHQRISAQLGRNFSILSQLETTDKELLLSDVLQLKKKYFLSNAELYYYMKQSKLVCSQKDVLALYFYFDEKQCPDCYVQGKILDSIRAKCSNFKVFSFPIDVDLGTTNFFKAMFGINSAPTIVLDDKTILTGLQSEAQIMQNFECVPAN